MHQPPYGPEDLEKPRLPGPQFLELLHRQRQHKYPEPPPFFQALRDGTVKREFLELWVKDLYYYWDHGSYFSTGAIFAKTNDEKVRTSVLKKLVNVEGKDVVNDLTGWTTPSYEELWLRFGEGLGLTRDEIKSWKMFTRSYFATTALCVYARWWEWSWLDGIASFYAADLLGKEVMGDARAALKKHYDIADEHLEFFTNYVEDVTNDIPWEEEALAYWACTTERQLTAARAFRNRLDIEYQLVLPLYTAATGERWPLQVP